ncbi:MAG: hypothetical protein U0P81_12045 [Holophagaceae bacterium]
MRKLTLRRETLALLTLQGLRTVAAGVSIACTNLCPTEHTCPSDCQTCLPCDTQGTAAPSNGTRCTSCRPADG